MGWMNIFPDDASFAWGVPLIVATIALHTTGVASMALGMNRLRRKLEAKHLPLWRAMPAVIGVVAVIALLLTVLHGLEATLWALAYLWLGAFESAGDAMLFSLGSMTTVGAPALVLQRHWQMMGVLEAANGMLLFGISTAYLFVAMQIFWPLLHSED
jgi:hypothetical protein